MAYASTIVLQYYYDCYYCYNTSFTPYGKFGSPYPGKAIAAASAALPIPNSRAAFSCVQTKAWLPMLGIFNVRTDINTCDCTRGLYRHRKRVCIES